MVNYGKTKIYKIWSPLGDKIYIGSTTKEYLSQRMVQHRYEYKIYLENNKKHCMSVIIFKEYGIDNCFIELIESKECINKEDQQRLEGKYIRELNCVNKCRPDVTIDETIERIKTYKKQYRENHKDEISIYNKIKCNCICGSKYNKTHKLRHEQTEKHLNFINQSQSQ
jgi:hypothetical protein